MGRTCSWALVASFATSVSALAQTPVHVGHWTGTMHGHGRGELPVELSLSEAGGTWRMSAPAGAKGAARNNPCFGRDLPVSVTDSSADRLAIDIRGGEVMQGCMDQRITLAPEGDGFKGVTGDGRAVSLTRQK